MDKSLIILALETLREQVHQDSDTYKDFISENQYRLERIDKQLDLIKKFDKMNLNIG